MLNSHLNRPIRSLKVVDEGARALMSRDHRRQFADRSQRRQLGDHMQLSRRLIDARHRSSLPIRDQATTTARIRTRQL